MSRVTLALRLPAMPLRVFRHALLAVGRVALIVGAAGMGTVLLLRLTGPAPIMDGPVEDPADLLPLVAVPAGVWLGSVLRSLTWLVVGQVVGLRLGWLFVGTGPFVAAWVRPRRVIVLRAFPTTVRPALVATNRRMIKPQYWLTALWSLVVMAGGALLLWQQGPAPWGRLGGVGVALSLVVALWPYRDGEVTDLWILLRLPFVGGERVAALVTDENVVELEIAQEACDAARARAALGRLEAHAGDDPRLCHWRATVLEMEGRYVEALREQRREMDLCASDVARPWQLMSFADLLLAAGDARQLPIFEWKPAAEAALREIAPPTLPGGRVAATRAYYCVLTGDYRTGARLARSGIRRAGSRIEAAQSWCALAVALAGSWDPAGAAEALEKARTLAPHWPRVTHTEERVRLLMPVPM